MRTLEEQAILKLLEMDIPSKQAQACVRKVIRQSNAAQPLSSVVKKAFRLALSMEKPSPQELKEQAEDLRKLSGENLYEAMKGAGFIANADDDL